MSTIRKGRLAAVVVSGALAAAGLGLGGATAANAAAMPPTVMAGYVGTFPTKADCEYAANRYKSAPDTADYYCASNGNPANENYTYSLYNSR